MESNSIFSRSDIVIDTSIFVNPETQKLFGDSTSNLIEGFLDICHRFSLEVFLLDYIFLTGFGKIVRVGKSIDKGSSDAFRVFIPVSKEEIWHSLRNILKTHVLIKCDDIRGNNDQRAQNGAGDIQADIPEKFSQISENFQGASPSGLKPLKYV